MFTDVWLSKFLNCDHEKLFDAQDRVRVRLTCPLNVDQEKFVVPTDVMKQALAKRFDLLNVV